MADFLNLQGKLEPQTLKMYNNINHYKGILVLSLKDRKTC